MSLDSTAMMTEDIHSASASTDVISTQEETVTSEQQSYISVLYDPGCSSINPNPQQPVKRKRGRPRKQPNKVSKPNIDKVTMEIVAGNALKEIQGSLGMGQAVENNDARFMEMLKEKPVKKGRGRPRKNPMPVSSTEINKAILNQTPINEGETSSPVKKGRGRPRKIPVQLPPVVNTSHLPSAIHLLDSNSTLEPMFAEPAKLLHALPECEVTKSQVDIACVEGPSTTLHLLKDKTLNSSPGDNPSKPLTSERERPKMHALSQPDDIDDNNDMPLPSIGGVVEAVTPLKRKRGRPPSSKSSQLPVAKKPRGRPRKVTTESNNPQEPQIKKKRGRPKKIKPPTSPPQIPNTKLLNTLNTNPPDIQHTPQEAQIKRKRGRPKKIPETTTSQETKPGQPIDPTTPHVLPDIPQEPQIKRKRGRPKKIQQLTNPQVQEPKVKRKPGRPRINPEAQQEPKIKRKRGRPRKDQNSDRFLDSVIPAQSSEPVAHRELQLIEPFPVVALAPPGVFSGSSLEELPQDVSNETLNSSRDDNKVSGFKLQMSSSECDTAESGSIEDDVAMAIVTLSGGDPPRQESPLLNESFDESFDDDD